MDSISLDLVKYSTQRPISAETVSGSSLLADRISLLTCRCGCLVWAARWCADHSFNQIQQSLLEAEAMCGWITSSKGPDLAQELEYRHMQTRSVIVFQVIFIVSFVVLSKERNCIFRYILYGNWFALHVLFTVFLRTDHRS